MSQGNGAVKHKNKEMSHEKHESVQINWVPDLLGCAEYESNPRNGKGEATFAKEWEGDFDLGSFFGGGCMWDVACASAPDRISAQFWMEGWSGEFSGRLKLESLRA